MEPDANRVLGPTLLAVYLMISGIVLLNLLIAMVCASNLQVEMGNNTSHIIPFS